MNASFSEKSLQDAYSLAGFGGVSQVFDFGYTDLGGGMGIDVECNTSLPVTTPAEKREEKFRRKLLDSQNKANKLLKRQVKAQQDAARKTQQRLNRQMNEEFTVYANKVTKYLADATIVAKLSHWNCRGKDFYETHLLFDRIYGDLDGLMDGLVETLRACGFDPDFQLFSGPGISMDFFDSASLVELVTDYVMTLSSAVGMFYRFCEENKQDPRLIGVSNHLQGMSETTLNGLYLLQAATGN